MAWWNIRYPFKRELTITGPVIQSHPITVAIPYAQSNKVRPDFMDIEVVWTTNAATPVFQAIPRDVFVVDSVLYVRFAAQASIVGQDKSYAVYFSNSALIDTPTRTGLSASLYPIVATPSTGLGLSFARPNEDWANGASLTVGARATFSFVSTDARLVMEKGPDRGIAIFKLDNEPEFQVDMFNPTPLETIVWTGTNLSPTKHNLRIRADGNKRPASTSSQIKIVSGQYANYVVAEIGQEEIYTGLSSIRIMVGV